MRFKIRSYHIVGRDASRSLEFVSDRYMHPLDVYGYKLRSFIWQKSKVSRGFLGLKRIITMETVSLIELHCFSSNYALAKACDSNVIKLLQESSAENIDGVELGKKS